MEMVTCNEGHIFCMDCLRRYVEEKVFGNGDLGKEGSTELCCMDTSGCQSFFSRDQLSRSLSEKIMKKYDELQTTLVLEKAGLSDICKCPKCDFQASLPESEKILKCPSCAYESCRMCGEDSHIPLRCEEVVKDRTETSARLQIEEAMTKARIRYCPKGCKQGFYKVEGCNKMTCPTCKTFICYVCRVEITKVSKFHSRCLDLRLLCRRRTLGDF
jgi:TRIAD3 protein (E3 ubiquitin-protein ligase RNF216)